MAQGTTARPRAIKPRLSLTSLSLHSPSSIVGTPFDVSPRFEYPFPPSDGNVEPEMPAVPSFMPFTSPFAMALSATFGPPSIPPPSLPPSISRGEARSHSPTHPKLQPRDPPVPPTLAKKRWSNTISGPIFSQCSHSSQSSRPPHGRKRSRSAASLKAGPDASEESETQPPIKEAWKDPMAQSEAGCAASSQRSPHTGVHTLEEESEVIQSVSRALEAAQSWTPTGPVTSVSAGSGPVV